MSEPNYRNLIVWQKADEFARSIYIKTKKFPREELYGIVSQIRRSALSVPTNIVEGYARKGKNELKHFLWIAQGSLAETTYLLDFSLNMGFILKEEYAALMGLKDEVGKLLWGFRKSI